MGFMVGLILGLATGVLSAYVAFILYIRKWWDE